MQNTQPVTDQDLYAGLSTEEIDALKKEVQQRWGSTDAYRQSQERVAKFTKGDWQALQEETDQNLKALVALMNEGKQPTDAEVQKEIATHRAGINRFYECTDEIYGGLAEMYVVDPRFRAFYEKHDPGLPEFLTAGMKISLTKA